MEHGCEAGQRLVSLEEALMNDAFYQCPVCNQNFGSFEDLHAHTQEFHNPVEDEEVSMESAGGPFPCPECGVELTTAEDVEDHVALEHPGRAGMGHMPIQEGRGSKGTF
jgi:hypothetical protein